MSFDILIIHLPRENEDQIAGSAASPVKSNTTEYAICCAIKNFHFTYIYLPLQPVKSMQSVAVADVMMTVALAAAFV